ncbi:MAG: hypothetical protein COB09_18520 [Thalassobium sp.]|nr:MAG: hypothetical protein COB09_18520 [Thalassobium sp.]
MTTLNEARQVVYNTFVDDWGDETPYDLEDDDFTEPESGNWVRLTIKGLPGGQESLNSKGKRRYIRRQLLVVEVYGQPRTGEYNEDVYAERIRDLFEGETIGGVVFNDGDIMPEGTKNNWRRVSVTVQFQYYEIK